MKINNDGTVEDLNQFALNDNAGEETLKAAFEQIARMQNGEEIDLEEKDPRTEPQEEPEEEEQEDHEEDHEEEDPTEEDDESEVAPPKEKVKKLDKLWKVKRSRFKALAEKRVAQEETRKIAEENSQLKELLKQAQVASTYQYGRNVYADLHRAEEQLRSAFAAGDTDKFIEWTKNLTKAQGLVDQVEQWAIDDQPSSNYIPPKEEYNAPAEIQQDLQQIAANWLTKHKELREDSKYYDETLTRKVRSYAQKLDKVMGTGPIDQDYYEAYFETLDEYIDDIKQTNRVEKKRKNLEAVSHVGSVRNSYSNSQNEKSNTIRMTLTPEEKDCARAWGMTEETYLKRKMQDEQQRK